MAPEDRNRKHLYIASITRGIPRPKNFSKATIKRRIVEQMVVNREREETLREAKWTFPRVPQ